MKSAEGPSHRYHRVYPAGDDRLRRLAAKDILDQHGKYRELDELTRRIEAIETAMKARS